jgi:probable phosphoglycerate mutase
LIITTEPNNKPPHKTVYIVRHAQTDYNLQGVVQGRGIDAPINHTGSQQAQRLFEAYKHVQFDKIYISTLVRTQQTVQNFIDLGIEYTSLAGLDEFDWGIYEGKIGNYQTQTEYLNLINAWQCADYHAKPPQGESPHEVAQRQQVALEYIFANTHEKTIMICTHGRAMRLLLCLLLGQAYSNMDNFAHTNTCVYVLHYNHQMQPTLWLQNSVAHLE